ncbi:hypothetical protein SAMN05421810_102672 [Amycolatopsis arida]|uniref:Molecular chaperone Hsp90 n=1 Tax=Amycolatopsis arida TaxID=587909 RepID=A0A1I5QKT3_9PSEU|nr:molecular chaperone Hsp90 [Amycolatopsis arida]TDX98876.1 hypothetical protein CLV69_101673 [Amycolatopsis arida]SFP46707.1 hypothetical protein SAMN05421810_102672 [Amycolatopsis arida]
MSEPFGADALRAATLRAWRDSPTRFTEDTNAERDLRVGGYRDRLFVELAQNAADAAALAGVPGRLRVTVVDGELRVANTGAPLDAAGVASLASLRASAKRGGTVGRFGVGFAAVLTVTSAPRIVSGTGGVAFSAERTAEAVGRGGNVPVLRLPWPLPPGEAPVPDGYDSEVRLPLGAGVDPADLLAEVAREVPDLLLALRWLGRVEVAGAVWTRTEAGGVVELAGPDGDRQRWLTAELPEGGVWAVPVDDGGEPRPRTADVLHTPTPTDERLSLPARLLAAVPVEPTRRRALPGPELTRVLERAAAGYPELATRLAPAHRLAMVPTADFPLSDVDEQLRELVRRALETAAWLPAADGGEVPAGGAGVLAVDAPELVEQLAGVLPGLLAAPLCGPRATRALAPLGARVVGAAELVDAVTGLDRPPEWWHRLYTALLDVVEAHGFAAGELGALPVPLLDGRTMPGPRGALLLADLDPELADRLTELDVSGLRLVHPAAAHPLLERLGAVRAEGTALLDAPELREAVRSSVADAHAGVDVRPLAEVVLRLVPEVGADPGLGALALPGEHGWRRADELVLPGAVLLDVLDPEALGEDAPLDVLAADVAERWPATVLERVGVLAGFAVVVDDDPAEPDHDLPDEAEWWEAGPEPPRRVHAVRDLDLVADDAWPGALRLLAGDPRTWRALTEPGGHTGWWVARYALLAGRPPLEWRLPAAEGLAGLYDPVPGHLLGGLPEPVLRAAGVRAELAVLDAEDVADLLDRLADDRRNVPPGLLNRAYTALAGTGAEPEPPARVRTLAGVADAEDAVVLDAPWLLGVWPADRVVAVPDIARAPALAAVLDLPLAGERTAGEVTGAGEYVPWAELGAVRLVAELLDVPLPAGGVEVHERLTVRVNARTHRVSWWSADRVHAEDSAAGLARAFAWVAGVWPRRHEIAALLDDPDPTIYLA